jgi:hypothetical protein
LIQEIEERFFFLDGGGFSSTSAQLVESKWIFVKNYYAILK